MNPDLKKQRDAAAAEFPAYGLLSLILAYGALLGITLTVLASTWSGMASLLMGYLLFIAPITVGITAVRNYKIRDLARIHEWVYLAAVWFFLLLLILLVLACLFAK